MEWRDHQNILQLSTHFLQILSKSLPVEVYSVDLKALLNTRKHYAL